MMHEQRGMTLIEMMVWISVLVLVLLALATSVQYFNRVNKYAIGQGSAVSSAQSVINEMSHTIREVTYSSEGAFPIASMAANDLVFYSDVDSDPLIEKVHYYLQGLFLMRGVTDATGDPPDYSGEESASMLFNHIRNLSEGVSTFRYYDADGAEITDYSRLADVRFVKVSLSVNVDVNKLPNQLILNSYAAIRNIAGK